MSSESGILADHLNEDNLNDDQITEDDPKQNSSSPELLLEAIRRIGRDKLRNIMLDLSFGSKSAQIRPFFINLDHFGSKLVIFGPKTAKKRTFSGHLFQKPPFWQHFGPKSTKTGHFRPKISVQSSACDMTYPHDFSEASPKKCISRSGQDKSSRKNEPEQNFENSARKNSTKNILDKKSKNFSKKIESKNKTSLSNFKRNNSERASQMNSAVSKPTQFLRFPATWWRLRAS